VYVLPEEGHVPFFTSTYLQIKIPKNKFDDLHKDYSTNKLSSDGLRSQLSATPVCPPFAPAQWFNDWCDYAASDSLTVG
jgi:hypothetical protein